MRNRVVAMILSTIMIMTAIFSLTAAFASEPEKKTLTVWMELNTKVADHVTNYNQLSVFQELEKRTGIHIEFIHPPVGQTKEQFNMIVASGDLPDLMYYSWKSVPGGPAKMIEDGVIIDIANAVDQYAPNYKAIMEKDSSVAKDGLLDDGSMYMMPFLKLDIEARQTRGFIFRGDWLDKLGLEEPTDIASWYKMLKAFKTQDPNGNGKEDEIPFVSIGTEGVYQIASAFGVLVDWFIDPETGKVEYGPVQPVFKDYLTTLNQWFEEGLIDPEYLVTDDTSFNAKMTNEIGGAFYGKPSGNLGKLMNTMVKINPEYELRPAKYIAMEDGYVYNPNRGAIQPVTDSGFAITTSCKDIESALKWCDYQYGEEGVRLMNFGIEGESYTMIDGYPTYTDLIMHNPDGLTPDQAVARNTATFGTSTLYDSRYYLQILALEQQKQCIEKWKQSDTSLMVPDVTPTAEESAEMANVMNSIKTYVDEMVFKFIAGQEPLDNFDTFVNNIQNMGLDTAKKIEQTAYERYMNR